MKTYIIILTAVITTTVLSNCTQPKRIFHGGYEVATPMSEL